MKKWVLVQFWRVQQVAMIASLALLALNLSLTINQYIQWRFSNSYIGTLLVLVALAVMIWSFGYAWDRKLKLWKEQMVIMVERNPYASMHMTPKEIVSHLTIWIPMLRNLGMNKQANLWQGIVDWNMSEDKVLKQVVEDMIGRTGVSNNH